MMVLFADRLCLDFIFIANYGHKHRHGLIQNKFEQQVSITTQFIICTLFLVSKGGSNVEMSILVGLCFSVVVSLLVVVILHISAIISWFFDWYFSTEALEPPQHLRVWDQYTCLAVCGCLGHPSNKIIIWSFKLKWQWQWQINSAICMNELCG